MCTMRGAEDRHADADPLFCFLIWKDNPCATTYSHSAVGAPSQALGFIAMSIL